MDGSRDAELVSIAVKSLDNAYCRYSNFPVAAALLARDGRIFTGVNVENASYGGTICAERSAFVSAVSAGVREFAVIAIATRSATDPPASPCGLCRQFMVEFGDLRVVLHSAVNGKQLVTSLKQLLPFAFTPADLDNYGSQ